METTRYQSFSAGAYLPSILISLLVIGIAAIGAYNMEHQGHHITGMSNQVIWGMPHVLAIFLIVSASGALNVASVASVFNKAFYKPLARLSAVVAVGLLIGGLTVILLDLGRPDRLIVAMTYYNFSSIFAWNIILYSGFAGLTLIYLWTMLDWQMEAYKRIAGIAAFTWRLVLTAGTGSIFGVLVAREAYHVAIMGPMFIVLSLGYGTAFYMLVISLFLPKAELDAVSQRLSRLLVILVLSGLAFSVVYHLANLYWLGSEDFEQFLLFGDGVFPWLIWGLHLIVGCIVPLFLLKMGKTAPTKEIIILACLLIVVGGIAQFYALIIGGQAFPMPLIEGYSAESSFFDGAIASYTPSHWEIMLGSGGFAVAMLITTFSLRIFRLLPASK
jgi:Ni/Fe-hydrogenase subunit HybB-like protein